MHQIILEKVYKRYGYQWIIHDFSASFGPNVVYGISGNNGSGKSTLIKMISGYLSPSKGSISYTIGGRALSQKQIYSFVSLAAPYTDLTNELTLYEMFVFHQKFKPFQSECSYDSFEQKIELKGQSQKLLQHFSSGMKQKIQLALAILSNSPILLLDEPTSYLDLKAKAWFKSFLSEHCADKIVIMASNDPFDLELCTEIIELS